MAHKKGKAEKATKDDDGVTMILDYLRTQNRPYSAIDISANLHNKVTKAGLEAQAAKVLKGLHQNKEIEGRVSGKQIVYHALQTPEEDASPEAIAALEQNIKQLQDQVTELKVNEKRAKAELALLCSRPVLSELREHVGRLEQEKDAICTRLADLRRGELVEVSTEEREKIDIEWKKWQTLVKKRTRICRELWSRCSEVLPADMTTEELWESLGLEGNLK